MQFHLKILVWDILVWVFFILLKLILVCTQFLKRAFKMLLPNLQSPVASNHLNLVSFCKLYPLFHFKCFNILYLLLILWNLIIITLDVNPLLISAHSFACNFFSLGEFPVNDYSTRLSLGSPSLSLLFPNGTPIICKLEFPNSPP